MKIGIIGSGNMGRTLGLAWAEKGHDVFFGSRNERDINFINQVSPQPIQHGTIREAAIFGHVLLYSLRDVLPSEIMEKEKWDNKIIIDCNNGEIPANYNYPPILRSFTEKYQEDVPKAKVIKALNTMAQEVFNVDHDIIKKNDVVSFLAGDDEEAKKMVGELIDDIGLMPLDVGFSYNAKLLESFADLVRLLMAKNEMGPFLTFNISKLPKLQTYRFGQRQMTKYK